jgi:peptide methionine sulfoxide reductase MsrA
MKLFSFFFLCTPVAAFVNAPGAKSSTSTQLRGQNDRRGFIASTAAAAAVALSNPQPSFAVADSDLVDVYFGVGCYWHIQHEFVEAERRFLSRADSELTSRTGYAGGTATDKEGRVCYHNFQGVADYGKLGHGEVVGMRIPQTSIGDFAKEYFSLFTEKGERVDPGDKGGEYRSLLGLPGGMNNAYYKEVEAAAIAKGFKLELGKGNDPDTLGLKKVFVHDTAKFPFYQAEVYHQFRKYQSDYVRVLDKITQLTLTQPFCCE